MGFVEIALLFFLLSGLTFVVCACLSVPALMRARRGSVRFPPLLLFSLLSSALVFGATFVWPVRPMYLRTKQVRTFADMQTIRQYLDQYREVHHQYPNLLASAIPRSQKDILLADAWGHPLLYESRGDKYIVVSPGRDGRPDRAEYWSLRESNASGSVANKWDADQVASDLGFHRNAGK